MENITSSAARSNQPNTPKTDAAAAENLISTLRKVVPQPAGAQMTLYARTGKLIVRNTPSNLQILEGILRNLDVSSQQVAIEVRLLEVSKKDGEDIGSYFTLKITDGGDGDFTTQSINNPSQGLSQMLAKTTSDNYSAVFNRTGTVAINAGIQAMVAAQRATILSSPKLTCLNNQTANIQVATVQNYIAAQETSVVTGTSTSNTATSQTIGQIPEGITLEITPNVSADQRTIRLTVHPKVIKLQALQAIMGSDNNGKEYIKNQLPKVTQRSLDTTISIRNGGTLVLGGLMEGRNEDKHQGVPKASTMPVVGRLFRNKNVYDEKTNLIIFITARILNADGDIVDTDNLKDITNESTK